MTHDLNARIEAANAAARLLTAYDTHKNHLPGNREILEPIEKAIIEMSKIASTA